MKNILVFALSGILVSAVSVIAGDRDDAKLKNSIIVITSDPGVVNGGRMIQLDPNKPGDVNAMKGIRNDSNWVLIGNNDLTPPENRPGDPPKKKTDIKQEQEADTGKNSEPPEIQKTWTKDDAPSPSPSGPMRDYGSIGDQGTVNPKPGK